MTKPLCVYHGNCADGFGAAWVVRHALGPENVEFYAGVYGDPPPDVAGRDVLLVDFSYKRDVLAEMVKSARTILVLDHHKSAREDLPGLPEPVSLVGGPPYDPAVLRDHAEACNGPPLYAIFDMERSGARIAWDFFFPRDARPPLISHIEDRDLWRFRLPGTRDIQACVFSYPYDFEIWDDLMEAIRLPELQQEGAAIERKHHKDIAELLEVVTRRMVIGSYTVWVANLPYTLASDAGHALCEREQAGPFGACYWDTPDGRVFSLRSVGDFDVSEIAKLYGGGGHRNAAGFRMPVGWEGETAA